MKIAFFSNYLNHHQLPLCLELFKTCKDDFVFVASEETPKYRLDMGYYDMNKRFPFVLMDNKDNDKKINIILDTFDLVIFGNSKYRYQLRRSKSKLKTLFFTERPFKIKPIGIKGFLRKLRLFAKHFILENSNTFLLSAGGFVKEDFNGLGLFKNRVLKWGYFPYVEEDNFQLSNKFSKPKKELVWIGRFIDWKRPEIALSLATELTNIYVDFKLNFIGTGELYEEIQALASSKKLEGHVNFLGALENNNVREFLKSQHFHIFTSDRQEGWGAVLNESMSSKVIPFVYYEIGAAPYLIKDGVNGFLFKDIHELTEKITNIIDDKENLTRISEQAYLTISKYWNSHVAAERLIEFASGELKLNNLPFEGPLSKA